MGKESHDLAKDPRAETEGGTVVATSEGNILDFFPAARRKASIVGVPTEQPQKGFADKKCAKGGDESLCSFKVGYTCKKGLKPESPNQDDFCIFLADSVALLGVFDGHGPFGHDISSFAQENLPRCMLQDPGFQCDPERALATAFPETHAKCTREQAECRFDCTLSGTTATLVLQRDSRLHVAHVGDSRAVLAIKQRGKLRSEDLTADHKADCETERRRIQASGGQVRRLEGDIPHRVFVSGKMYPGLAMTRSIGDTIGVEAGVTSEPTVRTLTIEKDWRFVLVCSDGIWEFISSQEAVDIVGRYPAAEVQTAVESLAAEAWNRWIREEDNVVDDITVICAWLRDD